MRRVVGDNQISQRKEKQLTADGQEISRIITRVSRACGQMFECSATPRGIVRSTEIPGSFDRKNRAPIRARPFNSWYKLLLALKNHQFRLRLLAERFFEDVR